MDLTLQFIGAVGILVPFVLFQAGRLSKHASLYLVSNLLGAAVLTAVAYLDGQWGFVILQAVWALVTVTGIARQLRRRAPRDRPARRWSRDRVRDAASRPATRVTSNDSGGLLTMAREIYTAPATVPGGREDGRGVSSDGVLDVSSAAAERAGRGGR